MKQLRRIRLDNFYIAGADGAVLNSPKKILIELTNRPVCAGIYRNLIGAATPPCKGGDYLSAYFFLARHC